MFHITFFVLITIVLYTANCALHGFLQIPYSPPQDQGSNLPFAQNNQPLNWFNSNGFNNQGQGIKPFNPGQFLTTNTNENSVTCVGNGFQKNCINSNVPTNQEQGLNALLTSQGWLNNFQNQMQDFQSKFKNNNNKPKIVDAVEMTKVEVKTWVRRQGDQGDNKDINYSNDVTKITTSNPEPAITPAKTTTESRIDAMLHISPNCVGQLDIEGVCREVLDFEKK